MVIQDGEIEPAVDEIIASPSTDIERGIQQAFTSYGNPILDLYFVNWIGWRHAVPPAL